MSVRHPKILYLDSFDQTFWSHRSPVAQAAQLAGAEVYVMTKVTKMADVFARAGFRVIPWKSLVRRSLAPWCEAAALYEVLQAYRRVKPDLVHHVTIKAVVYGGLAARLLGIPAVNALVGLGHVFTSQTPTMRALRQGLLPLLRVSMNRGVARTVLQNPDDYELLVKARVTRPDQTVLIRGSGVDIKRFHPTPEPSGIPTVILASRMLWDKGIAGFVAVAQHLKREGETARFVLVGSPDPGNPASIPEEQLRTWAASGCVEWWGQRNDMAEVLGQANLVCLPSHYGEGVPKVLLEAAACGRAAVTTDHPGCREAVRHGENGLLVPPQEGALADAILVLLRNSELRRRMGERARQIAVQEFTTERVATETLAIYRTLLAERWPALASTEPALAARRGATG